MLELHENKKYDEEKRTVQITATELKLNLGRYLNMASLEDVLITRNGKIAAKLVNPHVSSVDYLSGVLAGKVPEDIDRHAIREERLSGYEAAD